MTPTYDLLGAASPFDVRSVHSVSAEDIDD